jgi:hypothetical protein
MSTLYWSVVGRSGTWEHCVVDVHPVSKGIFSNNFRLLISSPRFTYGADCSEFELTEMTAKSETSGAAVAVGGNLVGSAMVGVGIARVAVGNDAGNVAVG